DRIMGMDQIELFETSDFDHCAGERHRIEWKFEERIGRHLDFMIKNIIEIGSILMPGAREAHGKSIGNKMDMMPSLGKGLPKFRCDHTRAAVRGITGNTNIHRIKSCTLGINVL